MLNKQEVMKLLTDLKERCRLRSEEEAFKLVCSMGSTANPDDCWRNYQEGYRVPDWWIDCAITLLTTEIFDVKGNGHEDG